MAPFFKKKRQSTAAKQAQGPGQVQEQGQGQSRGQQQATGQLVGTAAGGPRTTTTTAATGPHAPQGHNPHGFNSSFSSPQKTVSNSPSFGYAPGHYNTANIPVQSTFQGPQRQQYYGSPQQQQQQFGYSPGQSQGQGQGQGQYGQPHSRSAPQQHSANFSPYKGPGAGPGPGAGAGPQQYSPDVRSQVQAQVQSPGHGPGVTPDTRTPQYAPDTRGQYTPDNRAVMGRGSFGGQPQQLQPQLQQQPQPPPPPAAAASTPAPRLRTPPATPWRKTKLFNSPFPRYRHTASTTTADNGCMFVMGGLRDDNVYGDIWAVVPIGNDATPEYAYLARPIDTSEGVPAPRVCHNSILIGNAFIVYGGDTIQLNSDGDLDNNLYFFNINSMKWTTPLPRGPKPSGRYGHTITVVTFQNNNEAQESTWSSYLYLFGGQLDDERFNDMWCFDLSNFRKPTTQWRQIYANDHDSQYQPPPLANHTMSVYDGRIYVYGGSTRNGELSNALYCFNPADESWAACPYTSEYQPAGVEEHASVLFQNFLVSYGGKDQHGATVDAFTVVDLDTLQVFALETPHAQSPGRRAGHSMTYDMINEKLLVMGGDQLSVAGAYSSRDDVASDSATTSDATATGSELAAYTSIDPASLEYDTTYIYEFDLAKFDRFLNRTPRAVADTVLGTSSRKPSGRAEPLEPAQLEPEPVAVPVAEQYQPAEPALQPAAQPEDAPVEDTTADSSNTGSIQTAKKVNISRGASGFNSSSGVKRVDSINVHRNRRIKSGGSSVNEPFAPEPSNGTVTQDEFQTPMSSVAGFEPYQKVGSKVALAMESDDDAESPATPEPVAESSKTTSTASLTSPLPDPGDRTRRGNIPSAISDATMNSFLDNYTNSQERESSKEAFSQDGSSSSLSHSDTRAVDDETATPIVAQQERSLDQHGDTINATPVTMRAPSTTPDEAHDNADDNSVVATPEPVPALAPPAAAVAKNGSTHVTNGEKSPSAPQMQILYERLNELKKSLNEKMAYANDKIVALEASNESKTAEIESLKTQVTDKSVAYESLTSQHQQTSDTHAAKLLELQTAMQSQEKSLKDHGTQLEDARTQISQRELDYSQLKSSHDEAQQKLSHYNGLLEGTFANLEKASRVLNRQREQQKELQLKSLETEEKLMKKINELVAENENLKVENGKLKRLQSLQNSFSLDDDTVDSERSVANTSLGHSVSLDAEEITDSSINELSQGLDKLLETFRATRGDSAA